MTEFSLTLFDIFPQNLDHHLLKGSFILFGKVSNGLKHILWITRIDRGFGFSLQSTMLAHSWYYINSFTPLKPPSKEWLFIPCLQKRGL